MCFTKSELGFPCEHVKGFRDLTAAVDSPHFSKLAIKAALTNIVITVMTEKKIANELWRVFFYSMCTTSMTVNQPWVNSRCFWTPRQKEAHTATTFTYNSC